jgi:lysophospholipase L1-like esterase
MDTNKIRLHFSNLLGDTEVELAAVSVATDINATSVVPKTLTPVTFGGERRLVMGAHETDAVSDEIDFEIKAGQKICVSIYFDKPTDKTTGHSNGGNFIKNIFARGNFADTAEIPLDNYGEGCPYLFLNTIDFLCDQDRKAIIAFGDSITARPWPDMVNRHLNNDANGRCAVIRRAIGGNRVLREYSHLVKRNYGPAGIKRFEEDVCRTAGASAVVILHGINDLWHPRLDNPFSGIDELPTIDEILEGYRYYVKTAHKYGIKVYFATLLPCYPLETQYEAKIGIFDALNEWIRTNNEADGFIDFEKSVEDPALPRHMTLEYDSGDHLHPSYNGSKAMALAAYETLKKYGEI